LLLTGRWICFQAKVTEIWATPCCCTCSVADFCCYPSQCNELNAVTSIYLRQHNSFGQTTAAIIRRHCNNVNSKLRESSVCLSGTILFKQNILLLLLLFNPNELLSTGINYYTWINYYSTWINYNSTWINYYSTWIKYY